MPFCVCGFCSEKEMSVETFGNYVRDIKLGSVEFDALASSIKNEEALKSYASGLGYDLSHAEIAEIIKLNQAAETHIGASGKMLLSDDALAGVVGGVNFMAIGALVGGTIAAVGATIAFAPFVAAGAAAASIGAGIGITGLGGAAGTAIGAIVDAVKG
jgi:hypothetical protein